MNEKLYMSEILAGGVNNLKKFANYGHENYGPFPQLGHFLFGRIPFPLEILAT